MSSVDEDSRRGSRLGRHLRHNLVAYIALVVALTMTPIPSFAKGLVGTAGIKNGAVTTKKLHNAAVGPLKIHDGAVTLPKLASSAVGFRNIVVRTANTTGVPAHTVGAVVANCGANEVATGGGALMGNSFTLPAAVRSYPSNIGSESSLSAGEVPHAWTSRIVNTSASAATLTGWVVCASK
jgi:hypothetical protein